MVLWLDKYYIMSKEEREEVNKLLTEFYDNQEVNGLLKSYDKHDLSFHYALIDLYSLRDDYLKNLKEDKKFFVVGGPLSKYIYWMKHSYAFATSRFGEERPSLMFVRERLVPEKFRDVAAVHEYGEVINFTSHISRERDLAHRKATELEMEIIKVEGLFDNYVEWIKEKFSRKYDQLKEYGIISEHVSGAACLLICAPPVA